MPHECNNVNNAKCNQYTIPEGNFANSIDHLLPLNNHVTC